MGYSIPISTKIHVVFLGSVSSFFTLLLATPKVCSAKNGTGKNSAPQTSPLDFSIVLQPASLTTPVYTTNTLPAWAQLLLPAGEACAAKTIMQIPQGHQSTNKHLPSQYHPLITSLSKYNSEQIWGWICFRWEIPFHCFNIVAC